MEDSYCSSENLPLININFLPVLFSFRQVKPFLKGHNSRVVDPTVRKAVQQAEEALSLSLEQRKGLVNCLASDQEEEDDDEDCDQTMPSEDESPSKQKKGQKRKNSDNNSRKGESDDEDDDEVTGKKVFIILKKVFWNRPC